MARCWRISARNSSPPFGNGLNNVAPMRPPVDHAAAPVVRSAAPRPRLPEWLRLRLPDSESYGRTRALLAELNLHTVCESARCPNHWECWSRGTATFMIAGDRCTRACGFCAVTTAKPLPLDPDEPARVAEAAHRMRLRHVVITAVARDDLRDGGAEHFRRTIEAVRARLPAAVIEVLVPDFNDQDEAIDTVLAARPHIFNHNLETVRRLTPRVRSRATYDRSLSVLRKARARSGSQLWTKSGLMLGLGETEEELLEALGDLRAVGCDLLTLGQYLQPTLRHLPVVEFVSPERFARLGELARGMGFAHVASGPLVRSSYHADDFVPPSG
ncbi:MAG: lipoyl synthase [Verrucomicrobiae bacterium]|nr:lipoyl synthase [Verrucomicrobiae bacterium]